MGFCGGEGTCTDIPNICTLEYAPECDVGDCGFYEFGDSDLACCAQCCPDECVNCFVDPCDNYFCASDPSLECEANYCGGCNRLWRSSERAGYVKCEQEGTYTAPRAGNALGKPAEDGELPATSDYDDLPFGVADDNDNSSASRLSFLLVILMIAVVLY